MAKVNRRIFDIKEMSVEEMFQLGIRMGLGLIGAALLFVAAIYYGIINP